MDNAPELEMNHLPMLARTHLAAFLEGKPGLKDREKWVKLLPPLGKPGACFVTLTHKGALRGCIGSLEAHRSLLDDLLDNCLAAATRDPRFRPVTRPELDEIALEVSILTPAVELHYQDTEDLLAKLQPGVHGVILSHSGRRSTFLPQVWEQLPTKETFLNHLCQKAGLDGDCWRRKPGIRVYRVEKFKEMKS